MTTQATPREVSSHAVGAVLTYEDQGGPGACGQTIGADGTATPDPM